MGTVRGGRVKSLANVTFFSACFVFGVAASIYDLTKTWREARNYMETQ